MIAATRDVEIVPGPEVSASVWQEYRHTLELARRGGLLHSPFLSDAFLQAYIAHRPGVHLARGTGPSGAWFFPFQAVAANSRIADAVGMCLVEWQGVVSAHPETLTVADVCNAIGWKSLRFDHISPTQLPRGRPEATLEFSRAPWLDLSQGFEAYCRRRAGLGGSLLKQTRRKARKLEREVGPLQFEFDADVAEAMKCLLQWKSFQHARTAVPDVFRQAWLVSLLRTVAGLVATDFRGRISLLKAGGAPVAVHLGLETPTHAHMWYPAYNYELRQYSPGNILFLRLAEAFANHGVRRFDFGPGEQPYKDRFKTDDDRVAKGSWDASRWRAAARRSWASLCGRLRSGRDWLAAKQCSD